MKRGVAKRLVRRTSNSFSEVCNLEAKASSLVYQVFAACFSNECIPSHPFEAITWSLVARSTARTARILFVALPLSELCCCGGQLTLGSFWKHCLED